MSFTVYRSSAGSGKTFSLVKEYLKLALSDPYDPRKYRHILAVTFTNKAAAEMKERILKYLGELSGPGDPVIANAIAAETGFSREVLRTRAAGTLEAILHHYSDFSIGTIDSFVQRIVKAFSYELKLPVHFEIETDAEKLLSQAIDLLITRTAEDEKLSRALVEFAESRADDGKNWRIENELRDFAETLLKDNSSAYLLKLKQVNMEDFFKVRDTLMASIKKFENEVVSIAAKAAQLITSSNIAPESFHQGKQGIGYYFINLSNGLIDKLDPKTKIAGGVRDNKWAGPKASAADKAAIGNIQPQLEEAYHRLQALREKSFGEYSLHKLVYRNIYSLAVLNETEKILTEFRESHNILHISEFNRLISQVVMEQPIPFIYEHMGERYSHFLIDEFQDTSELQWQNLLPLIDNSLAENNFNMVVGDGKQAIYRWRGGEVEQFAMLPALKNPTGNDLVTERENSLKHHYEKKKLGANYRSKAEVVDFNNRFFRFLAAGLHEKHQGIYDDLEQEFDARNSGGGVSIEMVPADDGLLDEHTCEATLRTVKQLVKDGFKKSDIVVLTRGNRDSTTLAAFLDASGIPVISSESLLLKNSAEVNFVFSTLKYLLNDNDTISRAAMAEYLVHATGANVPVHEALQQAIAPGNEAFQKLLNNLGFAFNPYIAGKLPLYELCEEIIRSFGLGAEGDPYLVFFLDEVLSFSRKNPSDLKDFTEWWDEQKEKASLVTPSGADAVTLLTIHKSKGLEFPAVVFSFANWTQGKSDPLWVELDEGAAGKLGSAILPFNSNLEGTAFAGAYEEERSKRKLDDLNLLYVAMTRASERLCIITNPPRGTKNVSAHFINYLKSLGEWDDNKLLYLFGSFNKRKAKEERAQAGAYTLQHSAGSAWRDKVKIRSGSGEVWETDAEKERREYGILMHEALSRIAHEEKLRPALEDMLLEGLVDEEEKDKLLKEIGKLIASPSIKPYFATNTEVRTEAEILLENGESYRPDRVIVAKGKVTVIDYKTGKKKDEHKAQLEKYASILARMGYEEVEKVLIYTQDGVVEKL